MMSTNEETADIYLAMNQWIYSISQSFLSFFAAKAPQASEPSCIFVFMYSYVNTPPSLQHSHYQDSHRLANQKMLFVPENYEHVQTSILRLRFFWKSKFILKLQNNMKTVDSLLMFSWNWEMHWLSWVFCSVWWAWMQSYGRTFFSHIQKCEREQLPSFQLFCESNFISPQFSPLPPLGSLGPQ